MKTLSRLVAAAAVVGAASCALAQCPAQGSGAAGVAAWSAANCGADQCSNPAVTCNGGFSIELLGVTTDGSLKTFEYNVCRTNAAPNGLSHWIFTAGQIDCLGEGFTLANLIVGATYGGSPVGFVIGLDPTTQLAGLKIDLVGGAAAIGACNNFTITFDTSALNPAYTIGVGCVTGATKAGSQDIRNAARMSPGYVCMPGPVCELLPACWEHETAWSDGNRYVSQGNWATYTAYNGEAVAVTLFAGQFHEAGTVLFSAPGPDGVMICIMLNDGFRFDDVIENVKIQDYASAPSGNPAPGQFAHKSNASGDMHCVTVPLNNYYGVHVDVERAVDCPE